MVTPHFTQPISIYKKLIGTTENITNDAMEICISNTLSDSYETTIQILQQWITTPTAQ